MKNAYGLLTSVQISITNTVPLTKVDQQEIKAVCSEYRLNSCSITVHQPDATIEDFIDVIEGNRSAVFVASVFKS